MRLKWLILLAHIRLSSNIILASYLYSNPISSSFLEPQTISLPKSSTNLKQHIKGQKKKKLVRKTGLLNQYLCQWQWAYSSAMSVSGWNFFQWLAICAEDKYSLAQRNLPFIDGFSMQNICASQTSSMCNIGTFPLSSSINLRTWYLLLLAICETSIAMLSGMVGRVVSPPTTPQTRLTISSLSSPLVCFKSSFSERVLECV